MIGCEYAAVLVPEPSDDPPAAGARIPNESLHVPGLAVLYRNHPVVAAPFGLAEPFSVAVVPVKLDALFVETVGAAAGVVNERIDPNPVP